MNKNLIITAAGDSSYHKEWIEDKNNLTFDLIMFYYGDSDEIFEDYKNDCIICIKTKGNKYPIIKKIIDENLELIKKYDYIWIPDDDVSIKTNEINKLFYINKEYNLNLSQPSITSKYGVVWDITKNLRGFYLRYTNFVEVMVPLFSLKSLLITYHTFDMNQTGWGLDYLWCKLLDYKNIAIIDYVVCEHTKRTQSDYSRFEINPYTELNKILFDHRLSQNKFTFKYVPLIEKNLNNVNTQNKMNN